MLKLFIGEEGGIAQSATVPVRWCVDKETLEELKRREIFNPHLLLVIVYNKYEVSRQLVPLGQTMDYIQFQCPSKNRLCATIVWGDNLWRHFIRREDYSSSVIDPDGRFIPPAGSFEKTEIDIMIPKEVFAKERPRWEKEWVNFLFNTPVKDQCHYRRRALVAFTIQPVLFAIMGFATAVGYGVSLCILLILLLLGVTKGINLHAIHPWQWTGDFPDHTPRDIWRDAHSVLYWEKKNKENREYPIFFFLPLTPVIPLSIVIIHSAVTSFQNLWNSLYVSGIIMGLSIVILGVINLIVYEIYTHRSLPKEKKRIRISEVKKKYDYLFQDLVCNGDFRPTLSALPHHRRTIHLRYQDLKAKVCKPFAR